MDIKNGICSQSKERLVCFPMANVIEQIKAAEAAKLRALGFLHKELGYGSAAELAAAILAAAGGSSATARKASPSVSANRGPGRKGKRVPDSVRSQIAESLKAGESASTLPDKFGVSYTIVHQVKKKLGLVTGRGGRKRSKRG